MIHEIEPKIFYNQYSKKEIEDKDKVCIFSERNVLIKDNVTEENNVIEENNVTEEDRDGYELVSKKDKLEFITYGQLKNIMGDIKHVLPFIYMFSIEEERYFLLNAELSFPIEGFSYTKMFEVRKLQPKKEVFAASTAWHLFVWYRDNRFCGRCGSRMTESKEERAMLCPKCSNIVYPKIMPAVIVGVIKGDKILLTKYANREYKRYALIAGFNEIGESLEDTVKREVMEEAGIKVRNITYYKSQPWGFDLNVLAGFFCEAEETGITMDTEELAEAEWISKEDIPDYGEDLSLTHEMMQKFKTNMK